MTRVLVFGAGGQVGGDLCRLSREGLSVTGLDRARADITDAAQVRAALAGHAPEVVINAAAYTAVDRAEAEENLAMAVNAEAPGRLARLCAEAGIPLLHLSTDYVFDGAKDGPYVEDDPIGPCSAYGRAKAAGEAAVREAGGAHVILRTAWVYGVAGGNFVRTMLRVGRERPELRVVDDQRGCPTWSRDIAATLLAIAARVAAAPEPRLFGTFHFAAAEPTTWCRFAQAVFAAAAEHGHPIPRVVPITTAEYPTPARRPANSVLDCSKLARIYGIAPAPWPPRLRAMLAELFALAPAAHP